MKLAKFHLGLSIFYVMVILMLNYFIGFPSIVLFPIALINFFLFFSSKNKNEFSRKISVGLGVLMIAAFPIGTIIAFHYLPYTD